MRLEFEVQTLFILTIFDYALLVHYVVREEEKKKMLGKHHNSSGLSSLKCSSEMKIIIE